MDFKKIKTFAVLASLSGVISISTYLFNIFLARYVGLELHGEYTYVLFYATIAGQLVLWGTSELSVRLLAKNRDAFRIIILIRLILLGLMTCAGITYSLFSNNYFFLIVLMGILTGLGFPGAFENIGKASLFTRIYLTQRLAYFLTSGSYIVLSPEPDLYIIFMIMMGVDMLSLLLQFFLLRKELFANERSDASIIQVIKEGSNILVYSLSKYSFNGSIRFLIPIYGSMSMLSLFSLTWQYVVMASIIFSQTARVFRSELNKTKTANRDLRPEVVQYIGFLAILTAVIVTTVWVFGDKVLNVALGLTDNNINIFMDVALLYLIVAAVDSFLNTMVVVYGVENFAKKIYIIAAVTLVISTYLFEYFFNSLSQFIWFVVFIHCTSLAFLMTRIYLYNDYKNGK